MSFAAPDTSFMALSPAFANKGLGNTPRLHDSLATPQTPHDVLNDRLRGTIIKSILHSKYPQGVSPEELRAMTHYRKLKSLNTVIIPHNMLEILRECESLETDLCSYFQSAKMNDVKREIRFAEEGILQPSPATRPRAAATPSNLQIPRQLAGTQGNPAVEARISHDRAFRDDLLDKIAEINLSHVETLQKRVDDLESLLEVHKEKDIESKRIQTLLENKLKEVTLQLDEAVNALIQVNFEADKGLVQRIQELEEELEETRSTLISVHLLNWCAEYDQHLISQPRRNNRNDSPSAVSKGVQEFENDNKVVDEILTGQDGTHDEFLTENQPSSLGMADDSVMPSVRADRNRKRLRDNSTEFDETNVLEDESRTLANTHAHERETCLVIELPREDHPKPCSGYDCPVRLRSGESPDLFTVVERNDSPTATNSLKASISDTFGPHQIHPCTFVLTQEIARLETQLSTERLVASLAIQELAAARRSNHQSKLAMEMEHSKRLRAVQDMYEAKLKCLRQDLDREQRSFGGKVETNVGEESKESNEELTINTLTKEGREVAVEIVESPEFDETILPFAGPEGVLDIALDHTSVDQDQPIL